MQADTLIRWGTRHRVPRNDLRVINPSQALRISADKLATYAVLREAGIPVPAYTTDVPEADRWANTGLVFARKSQGQNGTDISMHQSGQQPNWETDFYCKVVPVRREYRVHVVNGDVIRVQGRYLDHPELAGDGLVRSHRNGWCFRAPRQRIHRHRREIAVSAIAAAGLEFGAVDLAVTGDGDGWSEGDTVVFEINAAPGCSPLTLSKYARAFHNAGWIT